MKHHKKQYRRILIGMLLLGSMATMMHACAWDDSLYEEFVIEDDNGGHVESCGDTLDKIIIYNDDGTMITYYNDGTMITNYNNGTQDEPRPSDGMFANAFAYNLCPKAAPNCMEEMSDTEGTETPEDTETPEETSGTKFICHNCPANYNVCKGKCVKTTQTNLHIQECILDNLTCKDDYYDFNDDSSDGCEFQLSKNHVINNQGNLVCANDYFDLNDDLNNKDESDGCEFQLSPVHIDKTRPQNPKDTWICIDGYADLDKDRYNGCEVNGWTDNAHCGAGVINEYNQRREGEACNNGYVCKSGKCEESCGEDYIVVCDGLCSNTMIDNAHCGGCNRTCSLSDNDTRAAVACQEGGCHAIACQPGYYLADGTDETGKAVKTCKPCADGKYTTSATDTACIACPTTTGAVSMVFDANNNICKAASCKPGYVLEDGSCEPCEAGTVPWGESCFPCNANNISGLAASSCTPCPAGTHTVGDDRTKCEELDCGSGYHVHVNDCEKDDMTNCGAHGNECVQLNHGESACINGQCVYKCHAGYYWKDSCGDSEGKCCKPCPAGSYCPTAGLISLIDCPKGHYCQEGSSEPTSCPAGTYQNNTGQTSQSSCTTCGEKKISTAGSATCAECKGNTHANDNHTACVGCNNVGNVDDTCVKTTGAATMRCSSKNICKAASCLPGYKLVNNEKCEPCPAGSISTSDNKCTQCLAGTYAEDNECKQCPAGFYCPTAGLTSPIPCTIGHYCPAKGSAECGTEEEGTACANNHPAPCPMGTYQGERGKTSVSECLNCPKGTYNNVSGAWACANIPAGYVGVNCSDVSNKKGCAEYSTCYEGENADDQFKCSKMYGTGSKCISNDHKCHKGEYAASPLSCTVNYDRCPGTTCCGGACVDTNTDKNHCGGCNKPCGSGKTCKDGTCKSSV